MTNHKISQASFLAILAGVLLTLAAATGTLVPSAFASYTQTIDGSNSLNAVSCVPSTTDCVVSDSLGKALYATNVSASASATWNVWNGPGTSPSEAVSCPTTSLCLLAAGSKEGNGGNLYYSTSLGGGWTQAYSPTYGVDAISCASSSFCVDGQDGAGYFRYSTSPASTTWTLEDQGNTSMKGVYCLSSSFCAIADGAGSVHVATSTGQIESSSWTETKVDGTTALNGIACTTTTACVAVDGAGNVLNLAIAGGGAATASKHNIDGTNNLTAVTCTTASTCVTVDNQGNVFVSTNGGETWTNQYQLTNKLTSVSCSSASLCVAAQATGSVTAFEPTSSGPKNTELPTARPSSGWSGWLEGQIFEATTGKWTGAAPITYNYQWERCNSGGETCSYITGATAATYTPTSEDVGHTLRVIVTAKNSEGIESATSAAGQVIAAQTHPEAHVVNSSGQIIQSYGETYAGGPGGQIQLAENYAHAHGNPKVTLDSGTFWLYPSSVQNISNFAIGVAAYSSITLEGTTGSEINLEPGMGAVTGGEGLTVVLGVFTNPSNTQEPGTTLNVSHIAINGNFEAAVGVDIGPESGPNLTVHNMTVFNIRKIGSSTIGTGMEVGDPKGWTLGGPVTGTLSSPVQVTENVVYNVWADGIALTGAYDNVAKNEVYWAQSVGSNGITVDSATEGGSSYININNNTLKHDHTGVGLDGSGGGGREMTVASNVVVDTCIGIDLNVQAGAYVGGNDDFLDGGYNPETDPNPYPGGENGLHCGVPGAFSSVGVLVQNSESNYVYSNYLDNYVRGVWVVWDGQLSLYFWNPTVAIGTQYNGIGLYYNKETHTNVGAGNKIFFGARPIDVEDEMGTHWDTWNAIQNNETAYSSEGCYFDHRSEEYISLNSGAGC